MTAVTLACWQGLRAFEEMMIGRKHTVVRSFSAAEVDAFGHLSGDLNPLHMNDDFASHSPFGRRVVHGLLTAAVVSTSHTALTGPGFAYVGQELRFLEPLYIGERITVEVTVVGKKEAKRILIMDTMVRKQNGQAAFAGSVEGAKIERLVSAARLCAARNASDLVQTSNTARFSQTVWEA